VRTLARQGPKVALFDIDEEAAARVAKQIADEGGTGLAQRIDVGNEDEWETAVAAETEPGQITLLLSNAAIVGEHVGPQGNIDEFVDTLTPLLRKTYLWTSRDIGNQIFELDGDSAHVESSLIAVHVTPDAGTQYQDIVFGRCVDTFAKRNGNWQIVHSISRDRQPQHPAGAALPVRPRRDEGRAPCALPHYVVRPPRTVSAV
jgi:NAD(P)-dependent dehydrogenase (short-subunit alcohol dehydrogenase family)